MRVVWFFVFVFLVACSGPKAETVDEKEIYSDQPTKCETLLKDLKEDPMANLVYEPLPATPVTHQYATIRWAGLEVPAPVADVKDAIISKSQSGSLEVIVLYADGSTLVMMQPLKDMPDLDAAFASYEYAAKDLTCEEPGKVQQLILKTIAHPFDPQHAYKQADGMLLQGTSSEQRPYWDWTLRDGRQIAYHGAFDDWGLAIGKSSDGVVWVEAVNKAVASPDSKTLSETKQTLEKLGFSEKTLFAIDQLIAQSTQVPE